MIEFDPRTREVCYALIGAGIISLFTVLACLS